MLNGRRWKLGQLALVLTLLAPFRGLRSFAAAAELKTSSSRLSFQHLCMQLTFVPLRLKGEKESSSDEALEAFELHVM